MTEKVNININGNKNKICLSSSYKFASKKINKKIMLAIVKIIEPRIILGTGWENIFFSMNGNNKKPIMDNKGSLKNNQIKI